MYHEVGILRNGGIILEHHSSGKIRLSKTTKNMCTISLRVKNGQSIE